MTSDRETLGVIRAMLSDAGLPFVPSSIDLIIERLDTLIERADYQIELQEQLIDILNPSPVSFRWERGDDEETMSA